MLKENLKKNGLEKIIVGLGEDNIDGIQTMFSLSDYYMRDEFNFSANINSDNSYMKFINFFYSDDEDEMTEVTISNGEKSFFNFAYLASSGDLNVFGIILDELTGGVYYLIEYCEEELKCKYYSFEALQKFRQSNGIEESHPLFAIENLTKKGIEPTSEFIIPGMQSVEAAIKLSGFINKYSFRYLEALRDNRDLDNFVVGDEKRNFSK